MVGLLDFFILLSPLLLQQALKVEEHQGRFVLRFRLDEILEVTFLIETDGGNILCINGYEPTTRRGIRLALHIITDSETAYLQCRIGRSALGIGNLSGKAVPDFRIDKIPVNLVVEQAEISSYFSGISVFQDIGDGQEFLGKKRLRLAFQWRFQPKNRASLLINPFDPCDCIHPA